MGEDIERLFYNDVRDKKRTATGAFHRASRRGYIKGGVKTAVDYLKGKEKKAYTKGRMIMDINIYDDINNLPSYEELKGMDAERAKNILTRVKNIYGVTEIRRKLIISSGALYNFFDKIGVDYTKGVKGGNTKKTTGIKAEYIKYQDINNLPSVGELATMSEEQARSIINACRSTNSNTDIVKHWDTTSYTLYHTIYPKFGIETRKKNMTKGSTKKKAQGTHKEEVREVASDEIQEVAQPTEDTNVENDKLRKENEELQKRLLQMQSLLDRQGFSIKLKGEYDSDYIVEKLMKVLETLEKDTTYKVILDIEAKR